MNILLGPWSITQGCALLFASASKVRTYLNVL
jgi:hypothetical protein